MNSHYSAASTSNQRAHWARGALPPLPLPWTLVWSSWGSVTTSLCCDLSFLDFGMEQVFANRPWHLCS